MKWLFAFICLVIIIGCDSQEDRDAQVEQYNNEIIRANRESLAGKGEIVGTLPDGRKVVRYYLFRGKLAHPHWVYVTEGSVTLNHSEQHGKSSMNHVEAIIEE